MNSSIKASAEELDYIFSTQAIRERCEKIYALSENGKTNFKIDLSKIEEAAKLTVEQCLKNYPDLRIPFHSRWKHFNVGGIARLKELNISLSALAPEERVNSKIDLVIVSVLLDAGAGMQWKYFEEPSQKSFSKSEGLAVASLHMFLAGAFSSDPRNPFQVDAKGLTQLSFEKFKKYFQVSDENPLVGDLGRFELLKALGKVLSNKKDYFRHSNARPAHLLEKILPKADALRCLKAVEILKALQRGLGEIWPGRVEINGVNVGDVWPHPLLGNGFESLVPFHKLSQWLTYSMVDPIVELGVKVTHFNELSCLAEYRNGGLLVDTGVLSFRDSKNLSIAHKPSSEVIVEWRAMTIVLMEKVATRVREILKKTSDELPLGKVLEGGTWWAGRVIAALKRTDAGSPILIESDGTVF